MFCKEKQDAELFEKLFGGKAIKSWPYWKNIGSFERMAELLRADENVPYRTFGIMKYRKDGFVAMEAGSEEATAVTKLLTGYSVVNINARCKKTGYVRIELMDSQGVLMDNYSGENAAIIEGDVIGSQVVWGKGAVKRTPQYGSYSILITAKNAEIFSLSFD